MRSNPKGEPICLVGILMGSITMMCLTFGFIFEMIGCNCSNAFVDVAIVTGSFSLVLLAVAFLIDIAIPYFITRWRNKCAN